MSRFKLNALTKEERIRLVGDFYDAVSTIKDKNEARKIFRDLFTPDEIGTMMRRIDVAVLLMLGFSYEEVVELLGVGKEKVRRVQQKLEKGGEGYALMVERLLKKRKNRKIRKIKNSRKAARIENRPNIEYLKKKYPVHFLLWNIFDEFGDSLVAKQHMRDNRSEAKEYYKRSRGKRTKS